MYLQQHVQMRKGLNDTHLEASIFYFKSDLHIKNTLETDTLFDLVVDASFCCLYIVHPAKICGHVILHINMHCMNLNQLYF